MSNVRFDRDAVSAIIRRAAEVTHGEQAIVDDRLGVSELVAVADEVGLSRSALVTALAELRAGVEHRRSLVDRLVGPAQVWAISGLPDDRHDAARVLQDWFEVDHGLRTSVRPDGVLVAEPKAGLAGALSAAMRSLAGRRGLERTRQVLGAVASVDDVSSLCVVADVGNKQASALAGGTVVAGGTGVVVAVVAALTTPLALLALPVGALGGLAVARFVHHEHVRVVAGQIEMTTEAVVRGEVPEHPVERFIRTRLIHRRRH
jgi:hypothetical protein